MGVVAALAPKNCDDLFHLYTVDGVYDIHVGKSIIQTYCEFDRNGTNWMVRKQKNIHVKIFERALNTK